VRVLSLLMVLLVGCATNSVKDDDLTGAVTFKRHESITPIANETFNERDREAQIRSMEIGRTLSTRLRNYDPK
jgi:hypothetical protein